MARPPVSTRAGWCAARAATCASSWRRRSKADAFDPRLIESSNLGKRSLGASLEYDGALAPGDFHSGRERRARLFLVIAIERQQTRTPQAVDFRQVEADAEFIGAGDGAFEMGQTIRRAAGRQQDFRGEAKIILRKRPYRRGVADLGIDQACSLRDAATGRRGPACKHQATRAPWRQAEFFRQRSRAMRRLEGGLAVAAQLVADAGIMQPMSKAVGMVEHFGESDRLLKVLRSFL